MYCRVIFNTLFGLSTKYWMALTTRFVLGALNGLLAPIKVLKSLPSDNINIIHVPRRELC